jgi:hypothetical protein
MKRFISVVSLILASGLALQAADRYLIKFRGTIRSPAGKVHVTEADLVRTNGNVLVAVVDTNSAAADFLQIVEADSSGQNTIALGQQVHSWGKVYSHANRKFLCDLFDGANNFRTNVSGVMPSQRIEVLVNGRITPGSPQKEPTKIRASINGIWNSPSNATFRGTMTGTIIPPPI